MEDVCGIPWSKYSSPFYDQKYTRDILEEEIYGLDKVKERIVEMICVNKMKKKEERGKGFIILLYGAPGTGKTSIAKLIAKSLKREARFIAFSGVSDSNFIKGHRRPYVDS